MNKMFGRFPYEMIHSSNKKMKYFTPIIKKYYYPDKMKTKKEEDN